MLAGAASARLVQRFQKEASMMWAVLVMALAVAAEEPPPLNRVAAGQIAEAIAANYFDRARGEAVAAELRRDAEEGRFDALTPDDFASTLTAELREIDRHFAVTYGAGEAPPFPAVRPAPSSSSTYGFSKVELLPGGIGLIRMDYVADFDPMQADAPARARADAALNLLEPAEAIIIDVRGNPGGSPNMVGYMASAFLPAGSDVYSTFVSRDGSTSEAPVRPYSRPRPNAPLFVLVDHATGSAAEALAYTLQAAKRAAVVGTRSAGAANPGEMRTTPSGFRVFVSDGSPRNPITGTNWEGVGVVPDHPTGEQDAARVAHVLALEAVARTLTGTAQRDARMALEVMTAPTERRVGPEYAGRYGAATISLDGERLQVTRNGQSARAYLPLDHADRFYAEADYRRRLTFTRDDDGRISGFELMVGDQSVRRVARTD